MDKKGSSRMRMVINYNIPPEVIFDIFLLLPMATLVRFKSVCKLWCKIIEDPLLVYMHSKKIPADYYLLECCKFHLSNKPKRYCFLNWYEKHYKRGIFNNKPEKWFSSDYLPLVGSCNGLICLQAPKSTRFQILNPLYSITDIYEVELPSKLFSKAAGFGLNQSPSRAVGFGFDKLSKRFKIVCFDGQLNSTLHTAKLFVHELVRGSSTSSSWRQLLFAGCSYFKFHKNKLSVFVDGSIHWLACVIGYGYDRENFQSIVSFNLTTEELKIKRLPEEIHDSSLTIGNLFDCNGSLGLVAQSDQLTMIYALCGDSDNNEENNKKDEALKNNKKRYFIFIKKDLCDMWTGKFCIRKYNNFDVVVVGFLNACEILMKSIDKKQHFSYNTQTGITTDLPELPNNISLMCHTGSLIRPCNLDALHNLI